MPESPEGSKSSYLKFNRSAEDRVVVGIAVLVANPRISEKRIVRLAYASIAKTLYIYPRQRRYSAGIKISTN